MSRSPEGREGVSGEARARKGGRDAELRTHGVRKALWTDGLGGVDRRRTGGKRSLMGQYSKLGTILMGT